MGVRVGVGVIDLVTVTVGVCVGVAGGVRVIVGVIVGVCVTVKVGAGYALNPAIAIQETGTTFEAIRDCSYR